MVKRKKSKFVIYFPVFLSCLTFILYFYFLYTQGHAKPILKVYNNIINDIFKKKIAQYIDKNDKSGKDTSIRTVALSQHDIIDGVIKSPNNPAILWPALSLIKNDNYPYSTPLLTLLEKWNHNNLNMPNRFVEVLQHFDYEKLEQRRGSLKYRNNDSPYKLYNIPDITKATTLWTNDYLSTKLNEVTKSGELIDEEKTSGYNHTLSKFLYGTIKMNKRKHIVTPSQSAAPQVTFQDFLELSKTDNTEYYYMIKSPAKDSSSFISKDLQIWSSTAENYFITNPKANHGTKCRICMKGGVIEAHYNTARNMIASIKGSLRVLLFPSSKCHMLINNTTRIIRKNNIIDWNNLDEIKKRGFDSIPSLETIILPGEILNIPPLWLYTIVSLDYSIECNLIINNPVTKNTYFSLDHCIK